MFMKKPEYKSFQPKNTDDIEEAIATLVGIELKIGKSNKLQNAFKNGGSLQKAADTLKN